MKKREWTYIMKPTAYEIVCMLCKGSNIAWSEFEGCIWCFDCKSDNAGYGGCLHGPIPISALGLLGLSLDRIHIKTGKRMKMIDMGDHLEWMMNIY